MKKPKKYGWGQMKEWRAAQQQKEIKRDVKRPGQCDQCGHGRFSLKIENRTMIRICKQCGDRFNPDTGERIE